MHRAAKMYPGSIDLVNNTGANLTEYYPAIRRQIAKDGSLPAELSDLFALTHIDGYTPERFRLDAK